MTITKKRIILLLKDNPQGMKARKIASILNADKTAVNSILYNSPSDFIRDDNYVWRLRDRETQHRVPSKYSDRAVNSLPKVESSDPTPYEPRSFTVAGTYYHQEQVSIVIGDWNFYNQPILTRPAILQPEPTNKNDENAIQVMVQDNNGIFHRVGYVPRNLTQMYSKYTEYKATAEIKSRYNRAPIVINIDTTKPNTQKLINDEINRINNELHLDKEPTTQHSSTKTYNQQNSKPRGFLHYIKNFILLLIIILPFIPPSLFGDYPFGSKANSNAHTTPIQHTETKYRLRTYDVYAEVIEQSNDKVGRDWRTENININVNGNDKGNTRVVLRPGDVIKLSGCVVEWDDVNPDRQNFEGSVSYTIEEIDLHKGFNKTVSNITIYENDGPYVGHKATVNVMFNFKPID